VAHIAFPFQVDGRGRTAQVDDDEYVRGLIEQVLFTSPAERVNRPTFGSGVLQLLFAPNSPELAATVQFLVQGALQQWLGGLIQIEAVRAETEDATLRVSVHYVLQRNGQRRVAEFERTAG
jgi:phage baseplate assembly protein W